MQANFPHDIGYLVVVSVPWVQDGILCWAQAPSWTLNLGRIGDEFDKKNGGYLVNFQPLIPAHESSYFFFIIGKLQNLGCSIG